jgi:hypothetical protein
MAERGEIVIHATIAGAVTALTPACIDPVTSAD